MKKLIKYTMIALVCTLFASCMGDSYADPEVDSPNVGSPYGNNDIKDENVITIKELKNRFKTQITTRYGYEQITEDLKIKAVVTGTDISGNIYNEVPLQDETGAIIVSVAQGGLYGYLPVGTEVIIDLKDLYVGNYGSQAQVGGLTTDKNGNKTLGRLNRFTWQEHFKITGNKKIVRPEVFADGATQTSTTWDLFEDSGKLGTIKNVTIRNVNENSMYADPDTQQSASWYFNEFKGNTIMIYNSPYSDFAAKILPQGKCNITGIIKRFNNTWEIIIRDENDVEEIN